MASHAINNVKGTGGGLAHNKHMYARLQLMYNITHSNTAVSAEELGMVLGEGRTKQTIILNFEPLV